MDFEKYALAAMLVLVIFYCGYLMWELVNLDLENSKLRMENSKLKMELEKWRDWRLNQESL